MEAASGQILYDSELKRCRDRGEGGAELGGGVGQRAADLGLC